MQGSARAHIHSRGVPSTLTHLGGLQGQSVRDELDPRGHVHRHPPHALDGAVDGGPVSTIVLLADRKEPREAVASPVVLQHRQQPRHTADAIKKLMQVHELQ